MSFSRRLVNRVTSADLTIIAEQPKLAWFNPDDVRTTL